MGGWAGGGGRGSRRQHAHFGSAVCAQGGTSFHTDCYFNNNFVLHDQSTQSLPLVELLIARLSSDKRFVTEINTIRYRCGCLRLAVPGCSDSSSAPHFEQYDFGHCLCMCMRLDPSWLSGNPIHQQSLADLTRPFDLPCCFSIRRVPYYNHQSYTL